MSNDLNVETLYAIGFQRAAQWKLDNDFLFYEIDLSDEDRLKPLFDVGNALYAFCNGHNVLYIGKTTRSLKRRMIGYCKPGKTQATNLRCSEKIRVAIANGEEIIILAFAPTNQLQFVGFEINLAAGLEDALIRQFSPAWNGGRKGVTITESAEIEAAQENNFPSLDGTLNREIGRFSIRLGATYYNQGIVNPGVEASPLLGKENETLVIRFSDGAPAIATRIDRRANRTGAVRLVGSNQAIADWFQENFQIGDVVTGRILGPYEIEFLVSSDTAAEHDKRHSPA